MKLKYLLIMHCQEQGYWDTSGYCHWSIPAFYNTEQFDLDQEQDLIQCLATFIEKYPPGEHEIHLVHPYKHWSYDDDEWEAEQQTYDKILNIECEAMALSKKIAEQKKIKEKEKAQKEKDTAIQQEKEKELKLLAKLKEKYEKI